MPSLLHGETLNDLFARLFFTSRQDVSERTSYPSTLLDMPLDLGYNTETYNVMPRLKSETVERIARSAINGNLDDMLTLSMLYSVGLGLPESEEHGISWANYSILGGGTMQFEDACDDLEKHLKRLPKKEFVYPRVVDHIYESMMPTYKKVALDDLPGDTYLLSPLLAGIRLFAIYRVHMTDERSYCYLYDVRVGGVGGERISLDLANKLNIPNYIGSHGCESPEYKRIIQPDYVRHMDDYLEGPPKYFVVAGTLTVPNNVKHLIRQVLPESRTVSDLFNLFLDSADEERKPIENLPGYQKVVDTIQGNKDRIKRIKDGSEYQLLKEEFADLKKQHKKAKRAGEYAEAAEIKERAMSVKRMSELIKEGKAIPLLSKKVVKMQKRLDELRAANDEHLAEQYAKAPEHFFSFVASDIYYGHKGKTLPVPVGQNINQHLQSAGFTVVNVNLLDDYQVIRTKGGTLSEKTFTRVVSKFEERFPEHKVTGLVARPIEMGSVKKQQKLPVYIVTST